MAVLLSACIALLLMLAATSANAANGSASDQYVGTVPTAGGDESPAKTVAPVANSNGVVTPDSVEKASEDANDKSSGDDSKSGAAATGSGEDPPNGGVPAGTVPAAGSDDGGGSTGFTLTNFNSPTGAAAIGIILIAAGGAMLSLSRRRMSVKLPTPPPID